MERCKWPTLDRSPLYQTYHDTEWGVASYEDSYLFEMLLLESFHSGLSWLLVLTKREAFRAAFDGFDPEMIARYDEPKVAALLADAGIIRNESKIRSAITNAQAFLAVQREFGSFCDYIWSFTGGEVRYGDFNEGLTTNDLSDRVSKDLKKRGFRFMGSVTTYSYLEAIGVMNNHAVDCALHRAAHL